jgi:DNA-binding MarR family transcriptional regulator
VHSAAFFQLQKAHQAQLIIGAFPQGRSSGACLPEMNEISFPLLNKWRCSISLSGSGKEDFFKHACASMLVEAQASAPSIVMTVILRRSAQSSVEKALIDWCDLDTQCRLQRVEAECTQVLVEVAHPRRQGKRLNAHSIGAFGQCHERHVTRSVASLLAMDRTTLTANLKPLARRGLVNVTVDKEDRRGRRLTLTPAGRALLMAAVPVWKKTHAAVERLLTRSSPEDLRAALRTLS